MWLSYYKHIPSKQSQYTIVYKQILYVCKNYITIIVLCVSFTYQLRCPSMLPIASKILLGYLSVKSYMYYCYHFRLP